MVAEGIIEIMKPVVGNRASHWGACVASGEVFVFCDLFQDGIRSIGDDPDILLAGFSFLFFFFFFSFSFLFFFFFDLFRRPFSSAVKLLE